MSLDLLEKLTFLFLSGFFVFSELYLAKRRVWGIVKRISTPSLPLFDLAPREFELVLPNGEVIKAQASPCALCLGHFSVGDNVGVTKLGIKYYLCPSLVSGPRKGSSILPAGACETERMCL